jgi:TolB-like protein
MRYILLAILGLVLFCGCAGLYQSSAVKADKAAPAIIIHPVDEDDYQQASVGVLPFQVPANITREQGQGIAALFKDVLLAKQVFQTVRLLDRPFNNPEEAIQFGRQAGVGLVLAGRLNYAVDSTELAGARVEVSLRLINVSTGNTVWYIEQGLDQPMDYPDVGFVNRLLTSFSPPVVRRPAGPPAVPNLLARIASDMADVFIDRRTVLP